MGLGAAPRRALPAAFTGDLPPDCAKPRVMLPGTLVVQGSSFSDDRDLAATLAGWPGLEAWPVVILVDDTMATVASLQKFLWTVFTRFEPAADLHARRATVQRFHVGLEGPVVFDCRMKPWYPQVLEVDPATRALVDAKMPDLLPPRWR